MTVVGAGFSGLACAYELLSAGYEVTVLDARNRVGGRVLSFSDMVSGKVVEGGGELIGSNHPTWVSYAKKFGLSFNDVTESETLEAQRRVLELCLGKLDASQRELLTAAYEPGAKFHEVAARAGKSATAFYKIVQRLRAMLLECVQRELRTEGAA